MNTQTQNSENVAVAATTQPEALVFGPVKRSATQLMLDLRTLLRERLGSGTDTYFWPAQDRGYYVITLEAGDETGEVDWRVPRTLVPEDFSLEFWVRRFARKEDYRQLRRRERHAFVSGRVWSTPDEGTYLGVKCLRYGRGPLDRDLERFFDSLIGRITEMLGMTASETGTGALLGYGTPTYLYLPNVQRSDEGYLGPLDVPYLDLGRLLHVRMGERLEADGPVFGWSTEDGRYGVRLVLRGDKSQGYIEGAGGVLAKLTMLRAPRYRVYLQIERGDAFQADAYCAWLVREIMDEFGVRPEPIVLKTEATTGEPLPSNGYAAAGTLQLVDPLLVSDKAMEVGGNANDVNGQKRIKPFVGRPPEEAVKASEIYALSDFVLRLLCKDPSMSRQYLRAKAELEFELQVTEDQIDYALKKRGTSIRLFRQQHQGHGYCRKLEKESENTP